MNTFDFYKLKNMNINYPWNGSILNIDELKTNIQYKIYPVKYHDSTFEKKYICLPKDLKITQEIKNYYNLS